MSDPEKVELLGKIMYDLSLYDADLAERIQAELADLFGTDTTAAAELFLDFADNCVKHPNEVRRLYVRRVARKYPQLASLLFGRAQLVFESVVT